MDDLGGDREQKTVRGWRHLAPRYKRDVKLLKRVYYRRLLAGTSRGTSGSTAVYTQCTSVCTAVQMYLYINVYTPSYPGYCSTTVELTVTKLAHQARAAGVRGIS